MAPQECSWASGATASSSYSATCNKGSSQNVCEVTGAPDVAPACGDVSGAWSPSTGTSDAQWVEASFPQLTLVHRIFVYETYRAPFVSSIEAINSYSGSSTIVWQAEDTTSCGSALEVFIPNGALADKLKVTTAVYGFEQIDAIQICGIFMFPAPPPAPPAPPSPPSLPPPCAEEVDLVMVMDKSGSIGAQWSTVVDIAREVVGEFKMGATAAQIGLVLFDSVVTTISSLTSSLATAQTALDTMSQQSAGGETYLSGGIQAGQQVLTGTNARANVPKVMLIESDGVQNRCGDDNTAIAAANDAKAAGTKIFVVAFNDPSYATLGSIASPPSSENVLFKTTAQALLDIMLDGRFSACVTSVDVPRSPPPSPPLASYQADARSFKVKGYNRFNDRCLDFAPGTFNCCGSDQTDNLYWGVCHTGDNQKCAASPSHRSRFPARGDLCCVGAGSTLRRGRRPHGSKSRVLSTSARTCAPRVTTIST